MPSSRAASSGSVVKNKVSVAESGKMTTSRGQNQNTFRSGQCIATSLKGEKCTEAAAHPHVPYCDKCMTKGDPSIAVLPHPKFGKLLAAKRDLPKGYRMALWGTVYKDIDMPEADKEWGFETADGWFINPRSHAGSQPQFCQCPGPNEKVTVTFATNHLTMEEVGAKEKRSEKYASMLFVTNQAVPKNHQLVMMYATNEKETEEFFKERGIERCDVWTKKYPTILKKNASVKELKLGPSKPPVSKKKGSEVKKATSMTKTMK